MRKIPGEQIISCQLAFYPLGSSDTSDEIEQVLALIRQAGVTHEVGAMSTLLYGSPAAVFSLLRTIAETMDSGGCHFTMAVTLSNTCGFV